jgi:translation initiation factor IF-2
LATRVFELARELGVRSKDVLEKCRAEGLEIKNHMTTLSVGLQATIRDWFSEVGASESTAVETTEHVDVKKARAKAARTRRAKKAEEPVAEETPAEPPAPPEDEAAETASTAVSAEVETTEAIEVAPEAQDVPPTPAPSEADVAPIAPVVTEPEAAEAPVEAEPPSPVAPETPQVAASAEEAEVEAEAPAPATEEAVVTERDETPSEEEAKPEDEAPAEEEPPAEPEEIKPAGPQVVPKPATLKGPRIIRVEKPDYIPAPRRSSGPPRRGPSAGTGGGATTPGGAPGTAGGPRRGRMRPAASPATGAGRKTRRRSPRRRSGQVTESGDRLKEWRDQDLAERSQRLAAASGGHRRHRSSMGSGAKSGGDNGQSGKVEVDEPITVKSLSAATGLKGVEIIRKLMTLGVLVTVNQVIDTEMAEAAVADYDIELDIRRAKTAEEEVLEKLEARAEGTKEGRAPVVTFLGHVDHGKTSLLDFIRRTTVADGEAGGITQHMGAYRYDEGEKHVVFLDTPGHEAFTAMRARGANMTDVVVLVVAADDGVMPQTVEAISHAKAAEVPIVVALNKIDVPNANIQRALGQLSEHDLQPREWGGETEVIHTSAETGEGIDTLVETLSLEAELLELEAEVDVPATGFVIESEMKQGLGPVARLLVRNGTLRRGDVLLAGTGYGRVRVMTDSRGKQIEEAGPATPVEVSGLDEVPEAGDRFHVVESIEQARAAAEDRRVRARQESLAGMHQVTLEGLFDKIKEGQANELPIIIKADVQGSVEALVGSLDKLSTDEVRVNILHTGVGGISTGDVTLAEASKAIIIGFNVVANAAARQTAETAGVDIRLYRVIYEIIEDIRGLMEQGLAPEVREETLGRAEVRQVFKVSHVGTVAGCYVTDGMAQRNASVRITRNDVVVEDGRALDSLKRFKDDAREVRSGMECGVKIVGYDDVKAGDILEFYRQVEIARKL